MWSETWSVESAAPYVRSWTGIEAAIQRVKLTLCPGGDSIKPALAKLALACRASATEAVDRRAQAALLTEFIGAYPPDIVVAAVDEWIATKIWFPAIAELREVCERLVIPRRRALARLQALAEHLGRQRQVKDRPSADEMAAIRARIAARWAETRDDRVPLDFSGRHPANRDTDTPEEKARIARICAEARANAMRKESA